MNPFSANTAEAVLPALNYNLPYVGVVDMRVYVAAFVVFVGLTLLFWVIRSIVLDRLRVLSQKTNTDVDDVVIDAVQSIRSWVYMLVALYAALQFFTLPNAIDIVATAVFLFAVVWQGIAIATQFVQYGTRRFVEKDENGDGEVDPNAATASHMVTLLAKIVLWSLGSLFVLSNLGVEITSLIAGLGIGGVAVAFALQGILSDLFASFSIYFDKPFRIGDFIVIGQDSGTVERIGIKSTRIRTLQGEELVVSNAELTTARVQNFKRMRERRVVAKIGIQYETPPEYVRAVPEIVGRIFQNLEGARLDRVHFATFGESALIFEIVFFITSGDYNEYMDIQQAFNFELMQRFAEVGIQFAYPTQVVHVRNA